MLITKSPNHLWTKRWGVLWPHFEQLRLWRDGVRFKVVAAGRRSGKTELAKRKIVEAFVQSTTLGRADKYLVAAPTLAQAEGIYWGDLIELLDPRWVSSVSRGELCIRSHCGACIVVRGLDVPQRIEGILWRGAVIDEIADCGEGTWERHVYPALAGEGTWAWVIGVPDGMGVGQADFRRLASWGRDPLNTRWGFYSWASADILGEKVVQEYKRVMDGETFAQEFEGKFVAMGGAAFAEFDEGVHVKEVGYEPLIPLCWALDFNVNPMCSGVFQIVGGKFRILHEISLGHSDTAGACDAFLGAAKKFGWDLKGLRIYGDATGRARDSTSGVSDWEIIRNRMPGAKVRVPRRNPYQKDGINAVRGLLRAADGGVRLEIDRGCGRLIGDLRDARWPGELEGFHGLAWLRYAAWYEGVGRVGMGEGVVGFSK